LNQY